MLAIGFLSLSSLVFSPMSWAFQQGGSTSQTLAVALGMLVAVGLPFSLAWRHRAPFVVVFVSTAASVVFSLGNALPLVALAALIGRRRGPAVWWTTAVVAATSTWVTIADALAQPRGASFWKVLLGPAGNSDHSLPMDLSAVEVGVVIVLQLAVSIGSGLLVRWRREAASATHAVQTERAASGRLGDEVARRQERERIAREVHDAMGHRLSLLSLHAGALEANSTDPRVAESAHLVRQSATDAMDDLRSLLQVLREPVGAEAPVVPLSELATVVRESFGAGQSLSSSIFISEAESADPALTRAVYRIVQEVLTNARKHAAGEHVFLTVEGSPAAGVVIDARNRYAGGWGAGSAGTSRGLGGITERAEVLGGRASYGLEGDMFRVRVELPWRASPG